MKQGWRHGIVQTLSSDVLCVLVAQSCLTLCNPMDCSPPGSSVHGIPEAKILEWVAISFSRGSSWSRDWIFIPADPSRSKPPGKPSPEVGYLQIRVNNHTCSVISKKQGVYECHILLPSLGILHQEEKSAEYLPLKTNVACIQESQRDLRNRGSTLKGHALNLTYYPPPNCSTEAVMKGAWIRPDPLDDLEEPSGETGATENPLLGVDVDFEGSRRALMLTI